MGKYRIKNTGMDRKDFGQSKGDSSSGGRGSTPLYSSTALSASALLRKVTSAVPSELPSLRAGL
jgi:hypothetical protein